MLLALLLVKQGHLRLLMLLKQLHLMGMPLLHLVLLVHYMILSPVVISGKELAVRRASLLRILLLAWVGVHATGIAAVLLVVHLGLRRHCKVLGRTRRPTAAATLLLMLEQVPPWSTACSHAVRSASRAALLMLVLLTVLLLPVIFLLLLVDVLATTSLRPAVPWTVKMLRMLLLLMLLRLVMYRGDGHGKGRLVRHLSRGHNVQIH